MLVLIVAWAAGSRSMHRATASRTRASVAPLRALLLERGLLCVGRVARVRAPPASTAPMRLSAMRAVEGQAAVAVERAATPASKRKLSGPPAPPPSQPRPQCWLPPPQPSPAAPLPSPPAGGARPLHAPMCTSHPAQMRPPPPPLPPRRTISVSLFTGEIFSSIGHAGEKGESPCCHVA